MRRFILIAFIGTFLTRDVTLLKVYEYPSNLEWLFSSRKLSDNEEEKRTVCESEECNKMANTMLRSMNKSVNPCDDFYEYACGRWSEHNPIPEGYDKWSVYHILQLNKTDEQVKEIVEEEPKEDDLRAVNLAKKWYKACMDTDAIERQGIDPLVSTLTRLGGWPMIMDQWDEQEYSWQKVDDYYMRLTGRTAFYDVRVDKNSKDPKVVEIDTPHLPPGSKRLQSIMEALSEEDNDDEEGDEEQSKSDEDPSNEEEQSNEEQEPGSEGEDNSKLVDNDDDDDSDDDDSDDNDSDDDYNDIDVDGSGASKDNDDDDDDYNDIDVDGSGASEDNDDEDDSDDNDDDDDDTNEKQIGHTVKNVMKLHEFLIYNVQEKITKIGEKGSKKLQHVGQRKSGTKIIKKHNTHKTKRQRIKRRAKVDIKRPQHFIRREKSYVRKGGRRRSHGRKVHMKRTKKMLDNEKTKQVKTQKKILKNTLKSYADYISKVAYIIAKERGTEISPERLGTDIQDMIEFQLRLISIIPTESIFNLLFHEEVTLRGFQEWYDEKESETAKSKINWVNKIKALFDEAYESVNDDLNLNIISSTYIENLISLLDETSNRTIVNYIHWNFISRIIKTTTSEMTELYDEWKELSTDKGPSERSDICIESKEIKNILAYEFVRRYFSDDKIRTASNMIKDIKETVEELIKKSDWMDEKAKNFALAKVKNLKGLIGYPNWYKNTTIIQEYFKELIIGSSYYENTIRYDRYVKLKGLRKLSDKNNEIQFFENTDPESLNPIEVNAFFMPWLNVLAVTAADFQSPWYADGRPRSVNFGTMGFIIAHEVNHGFDNTGYKFDKDGDFLGWFSSMADMYDKKEDCFVEQFNNYPIDQKTNEKIENYGTKTTGDNIADTMGLQAIFKAYQKKEKESETPDAALPGMKDFTDTQLFFLSFANLWCETINPNKLMNIAKKDVHSIGRLRVIGSISNSNDFATAYNCPVGSPMNPEKKCNIWK